MSLDVNAAAAEIAALGREPTWPEIAEALIRHGTFGDETATAIRVEAIKMMNTPELREEREVDAHERLAAAGLPCVLCRLGWGH